MNKARGKFPEGDTRRWGSTRWSWWWLVAICPCLRCLKCVNGECILCKWDYIAVCIHKSCAGGGRTGLSQGAGAAFTGWKQLELFSPPHAHTTIDPTGWWQPQPFVSRGQAEPATFPVRSQEGAGREGRGENIKTYLGGPKYWGGKKLPPWTSLSSQWKTWGSGDLLLPREGRHCGL